MLLMIDDTHRDMVLASDKTRNEGYMLDPSRRVDFLTSCPMGGIAFGELRGPVRENERRKSRSSGCGRSSRSSTIAKPKKETMTKRRYAIAPLILASLAVLTLNAAFAQPAEKFPARPVRMIVPYAPGGSTDITAQIGRAHV